MGIPLLTYKTWSLVVNTDYIVDIDGNDMCDDCKDCESSTNISIVEF